MAFPRPIDPDSPKPTTTKPTPRDEREEVWTNRPSMFRRLLVFFFLSMFTAVVLLMFKPYDLRDISGYSAPGEKEKESDPIPLLVKLRNESLERNNLVTIHENQLNSYLKSVITAEQKGPLAKFFTYRGLYVNLREGECEIFIERMMFGWRFTESVILGNPTRKDEWLQFPVLGGHIGSLPVRPGFLGSVTAPLKALAEGAAKDEVDALRKMKEIRFSSQDRKMVLDPQP